MTLADERISLMIFLGNYHLGSGTSADLARRYFRQALAGAAGRNWTYFITRSLFGLGVMCQAEGRTAELLWTLEILRDFVDESEQIYFSHLVNSRFKDYYSIDTAVEFDLALITVF